MAHPYHHSLSSVRKWGGEISDYLPLHSWFDLMWTGNPFSSRYSAEVVVPVDPPGRAPGRVPYLLQPRFSYGNHQRPRATGSASV
jgi:hypothetical protein